MAYCNNECNNKAANDCDYGLCGSCCDHGACHRHGWFEHECDTCGRLFENQNNLNQHMRTHMPKDKFCPACGKFASSSVSGVTMHVENGHCSACGHHGGRLVRDFMRHNVPEYLRPAICDGYVNESEDEDPYCSICDRSFKSFGALLQHTEAKHSQRGPQLSLSW
ncbi:ZNF557 [Symbiodinium pilosum]|uniref:ZNF557 protein n=1 Tax=Symbiodinium pilosum TaxID=2952 RepID=A0A812K0W0_SYMPI|nr:ZNF557 [Symbiodinium pilosum]